MALFLENSEWTSYGLAQVLFGEASSQEDLELLESALENFLSLNLIERLSD